MARLVGPDFPVEPDDAFYSFEPIIAYRGWNLSSTRASVLIGRQAAWNSARMVAHHLGASGGGHKPHKPPQWNCLCGINAYKDVKDARDFPILGRVALSGEVIEFERGYRAEIGEILALAIDRDHPEAAWIAKELEKKYKVPVEVEEHSWSIVQQK